MFLKMWGHCAGASTSAAWIWAILSISVFASSSPALARGTKHGRAWRAEESRNRNLGPITWHRIWKRGGTQNALGILLKCKFQCSTSGGTWDSAFVALGAPATARLPRTNLTAVLFAHDPPMAPPLWRKEPGTSGGRQGCQEDREAPGRQTVDHVGSTWKKCRTVSKCPQWSWLTSRRNIKCCSHSPDHMSQSEPLPGPPETRRWEQGGRQHGSDPTKTTSPGSSAV